MGLSKSDYDSIDRRLKSITEQSVEEISINSDLPPTISQLEDNNKTYSIMAAILFIDIRKSTYLTENSQAKSMVKIYRAFMRMSVDCVRKNGGVTRQFLGDRIMGVFIDSTDSEGNVVKATDKAVNAARSLQTVIDYSLNKHLKSNVNGKIIECGIGIDFGKVLVTQVGMYGVERDEDKEDEVDCVWVGNTTNYASKYSDIAMSGEIFISQNVYKNLSNCDESVWCEVSKYKGSKQFNGYVATDYYLEFAEELGKPTTNEKDNTTSVETSNILVEGIKEIERLQNKLIEKEKELVLLEKQLKRENQEYKNKYNNENIAKNKAIDDKKSIIKEKSEILDIAYNLICGIIKDAFHNTNYIQNISLAKWKEIDRMYKKLHNLKGLGYLCHKNTYFIEIYAYYKEYELAYENMVQMAKNEYYWLRIDEDTFKWACKISQGFQVINAIEDNLKNNKISYDRIKEYEGYLVKLKGIRGF